MSMMSMLTKMLMMLMRMKCFDDAARMVLHKHACFGIYEKGSRDATCRLVLEMIFI